MKPSAKRIAPTTMPNAAYAPTLRMVAELPVVFVDASRDLTPMAYIAGNPAPISTPKMTMLRRAPHSMYSLMVASYRDFDLDLDLGFDLALLLDFFAVCLTEVFFADFFACCVLERFLAFLGTGTGLRLRRRGGLGTRMRRGLCMVRDSAR